MRELVDRRVARQARGVEASGRGVAIAEPSGSGELAPVPDFRYVGLEPVEQAEASLATLAFGVGACAACAVAGADARHAFLAGALSSAVTALAVRGAGAARARSRLPGARMAVVPWGVLVERDETPRILRWAAVKRIDVLPALGRRPFARPTSRVVVETTHDRFEGEAMGPAPLEKLVVHLEAYTLEQAVPIALGLAHEDDAAVALDQDEPFFEPLLASARAFLRSADGSTLLDLPAAGYRRVSFASATPSAVEVLRAVLSRRRRSSADGRAFAAVLAAELGAHALRPELVALTQSPHPFVAAVAKQAARKLGVSRARTGTLDEVAPFLWEADRGRLDAWLGTPAA